ncbi:hypothetical protein [Actinophytocola sp.]|uniref:hypothetical protein n=1 Tax=Actinophytocola sp. TaxID=1872138 RepID=UPI00389A831B
MTIDFALDTDYQLRHAAHQYRLELGWTTTVDGSQLAVELDDDIWGLRMPTGLAAELVAALDRMDLSCPVIDLCDQQGVVLLLEPTGAAESVPPLPAQVGKLPAGRRVPLPPSMTARGPVRWLTPHEPVGGRRPSVRVVADALTHLT